MVFINNVDRVPPALDKKELKKSRRPTDQNTSFADTLAAVETVDAVEVTLSHEENKRNPDSQNQQLPQQKEKSKLNIEV